MKKYRALAKLFIDHHGTRPNYFEQEFEELEKLEEKEHEKDINEEELAYYRVHKPLREPKRAVGHVVRALQRPDARFP